MKKSQRSDTKKNNLIVGDKRMGVHEIIRKNNLKLEYKIMLSYCLKGEK